MKVRLPSRYRPLHYIGTSLRPHRPYFPPPPPPLPPAPETSDLLPPPPHAFYRESAPSTSPKVAVCRQLSPVQRMWSDTSRTRPATRAAFRRVSRVLFVAAFFTSLPACYPSSACGSHSCARPLVSSCAPCGAAVGDGSVFSVSLPPSFVFFRSRSAVGFTVALLFLPQLQGMLSRLYDERHLTPLLDFIQYVMYVSCRNGRDGKRLPKRINGSLEQSRDTSDETEFTVPEDFFPEPNAAAGGTTENSLSGEGSQSLVQPDVELQEPVEPQEPASPTAPESRKRSRSPSTEPEKLESPIEFELLTESSRGSYNASYLDVPFSMFGVPLLLQKDDSKKKRTAFVGSPCCYLKLGTSVVISGRIVDADSPKRGWNFCVAPDRGEDATVEWIPADRLYQIPPNLQLLRSQVAAEMKRIISEMKKKASSAAVRRC